MYFDAAGDAHLIDRRMTLAREWDELVEQVRRLDGFEDFLYPLKLEQLLPAAQGGPVVVINISRWRCDALIVTQDDVLVVPLPGLTAESVADKTDLYLRELGAVHREMSARQTGDTVRDLAAITSDLDRGLFTVFEWLWDTIAEPVLDRLGFTSTHREGDQWPRLWWCPTGLLTLLPLHAGGYHRGGGRQRTVIDRVVSSYTPTLRALIKAREPLPHDADEDRMLVVALSDLDGQIELKAIDRERDTLVSLFEGRYTLLEGSQATVDAVREQLISHRWAHFGCHGGQDLDAPSKGGLLLNGGTLDVAALGAAPGGEFAFLAACKSATGGRRLPDEASNLSAALHYAGYRHVIGTLWSVYDQTTADLADAFYRNLMVDKNFRPDRAAFALHDAVRALRDTGGLGPTAWTPYTHTGP